MDFHSLSRKELQTLCKKNKIPANTTNVAMADALAALPQVEGLDEFLNPKEECDAGAGTPDIHHRTACRASTQKKSVKEPESSKVSTRLRRGARTGNTEGLVAEQENKDGNVPDTPAVLPGSRRRVPAVSTRRKKEIEMVEDDKNGVQGKPMDVAKTPAPAPRSRARATGRTVCTKTETPGGDASMQQAHYSTRSRRSVRLLGKGLSKMSSMDTEADMGLAKIDDVSEELSMGSASQHVEDLSDTENGASLEVSSLTNNDSALVSGTENDGLLDEQQEEVSGKVIDMVDEPHDAKLEESFETFDDPKCSNEGDDDHQEKDNGTEHLNMAGGNNIQNFEAMDDVDEKAADEKDVASSEGIVLEHQTEELQDKSELLDDSSSDKIAEEDASSENSGADIEVCIESFDDNKKESMEVENVSLQFSLLDVGAHKTEDQKETSEELEAAAQDEGSENLAPGEFEVCEHKAEDQKNVSEKLEAAAQAEESEERAPGENIEFGVANETQAEEFEECAHKAEVQKNASEKLGAAAQAEESEERAPGENTEFGVANAFACVLQQVSVESTGISIDSCSSTVLMPVPNTLVDGDNDVNFEDIAIPKQEPMTVEAIHEQKSSEFPVQSVVSETKEIANEIQTVSKIEDDMLNANMMKENVTTTDELHSMSMRVLRKMLKNKLTLNEDNVVCKNVQEVEKKRTALQALPQNLMTKGEAISE
ncbi:hypothetical protein SESBI_24884 [Sesbania bispinosa]|nr:hypothetical protein SESBI_24884 [Sesbania bispinosa]